MGLLLCIAGWGHASGLGKTGPFDNLYRTPRQCPAAGPKFGVLRVLKERLNWSRSILPLRSVVQYGVRGGHIMISNLLFTHSRLYLSSEAQQQQIHCGVCQAGAAHPYYIPQPSESRSSAASLTVTLQPLADFLLFNVSSIW